MQSKVLVTVLALNYVQPPHHWPTAKKMTEATFLLIPFCQAAIRSPHSAQHFFCQNYSRIVSPRDCEERETEKLEGHWRYMVSCKASVSKRTFALHWISLYCTVFHCNALYFVVMHCISLHCTLFHCIALYFIALSYISFWKMNSLIFYVLKKQKWWHLNTDVVKA